MGFYVKAINYIPSIESFKYMYVGLEDILVVIKIILNFIGLERISFPMQRYLMCLVSKVQVQNIGLLACVADLFVVLCTLSYIYIYIYIVLIKACSTGYALFVGRGS